MSEIKNTTSAFENVNKLKGLLSSLGALGNQVKTQRAQVEGVARSLKEKQNQIAVLRSHKEAKAQSSQRIEELKKQRETERLEAEQRIDNKNQQRQQNLQQQQQQQFTPRPQNSFQPRPQQFQQRGEGFTPRPQQNSFQPRPQFTPRPEGGFTPRPQQFQQRGEGFTPRPQFANSNYNKNKFGSNAERTFTPANSQNRGFTPRPYIPGAPRPFTPRPYAPRPAGAGAAVKPTERFVGKVNTYETNKKKGKGQRSDEKTTMDKRALLRRGIIEEQEIEERMLTRVFKSRKAKENDAPRTEKKIDSVVVNTDPISIKMLSDKMGHTAASIIKQLMVLGEMCTINSSVPFAVAELVAMEFGIKLELKEAQTFEQKMGAVHKKGVEMDDTMTTRPPVVTIMGHVDHGKTSLLDAIRKSNVVSGESGGITQHIGAYSITTKNKKITFIDTPGHAAFMQMRARGAKVTDIAILIVAADDGIMPQTIEAIEHIQKANVPMIVAINKMDKPEANPERIKQQLTEHNVVPEEWGGNAIIVPISAHTGEGLDKLLDMIILVSELNGYKSNKNKEAQGTVLEARLDKQKGAMVTLLVQSGTLKCGDYVLAGTTSGKVKAMFDENGKAVKAAGPSTPVVILGFTDVPMAGDLAYVVDEKLSKQVVEERKQKIKVDKANVKTSVTAEDFFGKISKANKTPLNYILKADVSGSAEAIIQSIQAITSDEVEIKIISWGVGNVSINDVDLAGVGHATILAFNVGIATDAKILAERNKVKVENFKVIYKMLDYITDSMVALFAPKYEEKVIGKIEVRAKFVASAVGTIAGCYVTEGKVTRNSSIKVIRGGKELGVYKIDSLKNKQNDLKEAAVGFECGIKLQGTNDIAVGDIFEVVIQEKLPVIFNGKKYE